MLKSGSKLFCRRCFALIVVTCRDVEVNGLFQEADIDQKKGQAPWNAQYLCECRVCHEPFNHLEIEKWHQPPKSV